MKVAALAATITVADLENDPHPHLHCLRAAAPVVWLPVLHGWLVTSYALATAVMRAPQHYTVDHPNFSTAQVIGPSMLSRDGAAHTAQRAPFEAPFRRGAVYSRFTTPLATMIDQLLADLAPIGQAEWRRAFAAPIAVWTMRNALGLVETEVATLLGWYAAIVDAVTRVTLGEPVSAAGQMAFAQLCAHLQPALHAQPASSLLAAAARTGQPLPPDQLLANAAVLLFGGIETTEAMIANAFYFLLTNQPLLTQVRADPTLLPAVIEESLRLEPAAAVVDRYAVMDVALGGVLIKAGDLVRVSLSGANRDPAIFPDPDRFDPTRPNLRTHLAFAQGPHVCLGLHLARLEAAQAVGQALARLPGLQLVGDDATRSAARPHGLIFRKPQALAVCW